MGVLWNVADGLSKVLRAQCRTASLITTNSTYLRIMQLVTLQEA